MVTPTFYARSLTELVALRASTQSDEPAIHTGAAEFGDKLKTLTYSDVAAAVDRLAAYYASLDLQPVSDGVPPERVIAVLTSTAVDESLLEVALAKLGLTSLLLSVNNSVAAVAHLCKITNATHLIFGPKYASVAAEAQSLLKGEGITLKILPETRFPLWGKGGVRDAKIPSFPARLTPEQESKRTCVILHSSGSTGFPKPVYVSHYGLIANAAVSVAKTGFSALPLFHGFGHFSIFRCLYHGKTFTLMPPHLPITSANIVRVIKASPTPPVQHFAVPYVLKLLGETEDGSASLAAMEAVSFAGAAVPDDLGDRLVAAGVPLFSQYGTTETGALLTSRRDFATDKAWNWLRVEGLIAQYLELIPQGGNNMFEVVVRDGWPGKVMSNRDDGAYCTKDLVVKHPDHPTWVKYVGRLDDTLTQTLGEKTNPVPIELAIRGNSPLIQECIVFGDGRPQTGALILPSDAGAELSKDRKAFVDAIWPVIAEANASAPTHSRLLPEMIEILPYGTEIPVATKMSILRPACYRKFADIIDSIYDRFERGTGAPKRNIATQAEMESFLHETTLAVLGDKTAKLDVSTDLFAYGVDSLQATRIRNVIQRSVDIGDAKLGQNIVYEYPSITQLAAYLLAVKGGASTEVSEEEAHAKMLAMVDTWAAKVVPLSQDTEPPPAAHTVVLTGATGSLGAHILDQLARRPDVDTIICLSRAKDDVESLSRVQRSLELRQRSVPASKIVSYAADVNRPDLGLCSEVYEHIRSSATVIIHNAWPVNFNLSLESFDEHIGGAVNILNLARTSSLSTKPAFFFSSSVGTRQAGEAVVAENYPPSPSTAAGTGYARSKWVVEKVLQRAGGRGGVLRIGQLAGDTENGVWNETEAWPLMFRSAGVVGALPDLNERPQWMPVDLAGQAIVDTVLSSNPDGVYHILNSREAQWSDILSGLRAGGLKFETVSPAEWLDRLAKSDPDVSTNPTYKLLSFYQNRLGSERRAVQYQITKTAAISPTVADCKPVDADLVALWTRHWMQSGFL